MSGFMAKLAMVETERLLPPRNREPVSPIKTFAGLKFQIRNPRHPPAVAAARIPMPFAPKIPAITIKIKEAKNVTEAFRPSIPSVKLTALTIPTIPSREITQ